MRRNIISELMAERIIYGGTVATRAEVYQHAQDCAVSKGADKRGAARCGDWAAFAGRARTATAADAAALPSLADVLRAET